MERWLWGEARELKWPMLKEGSIEYRAYQFNIARRALEGNTLVVMPTGLGKTIIAALVIGARLDEHPWGRCVLLAPTRPLALQHRDVLRRVLKLDPSLINVLTGETKPEERSKIWRKSKILILTPQTLKNDIVAGRYDLEDVVLMVFDEAHRAVGNYPYVFIAEHYVKAAKIPLILAMTASPGSDEKKIEEICRNLKIEKIEVRDESSPDVRPYIQSVQVVWRWVELSEGFEEAKNILEEILRPYLERFKERGYIESSSVRRVRLKDILEAMSLVQERMKDYVEPPRDLVEDLALLTNTARIVHALELLEAQGMHALWNYMRKLEERASRRGASRYLKELVMSHHWRRLRRVVEENLEEVHPKFKELLKVLKEYGRTASRIIVFTNYRSTADMLTKMLCKEGYKAVKFIGQAKREGERGLTQREQERILDEFKRGAFKVLVATQVAEEGLDVAECDLVIFYDNVPSAIRFIQRRGRTGRIKPGKVIVLITKKTRDEAYYWSAVHKRKRMSEILKRLKVRLEELASGRQVTLAKPLREELRSELQEGLVILTDARELNSRVVEELIRAGIKVRPIKLEVGDYVISDEVVVERKSINDFVKSIVDKRLFNQAEELRRNYEKPIIIVEGEKLITGMRQEALLGAISSLIVDFDIPVIITRNATETARYLIALAKREQLERRRAPRIRAGRKSISTRDIMLEILSCIPGIDRTLADRILRKFRTLERVFTASVRELMEVHGVGEKIAMNIKRISVTPYPEED